jgi:thioredoxin-related protein
MKLFLSFCFFGAVALFGAPNWSPNYAKAFEKAKEQKKGVMIMLSQENCDACWYMENIVFEEADLVQEIEKDFIPLYLDVIDDDLHGLSFTGTPTLYFLQANGETIKRLDGVFNIKELTAALLKIEVDKGENTP